MNGKLTRAFDNDWIGPALVSLVAIVVISIFQPSFLSSFNILVLLSAIAVNMLIALGQLVIIAVGQMNLALGSIGGLVAISFAAMMELWHLPPLVAMGGGLAIGVAAGMASGALAAEAQQTALCGYLSAILLGGLLLNAALGWWWADPATAFVIVHYGLREGRHALKQTVG